MSTMTEPRAAVDYRVFRVTSPSAQRAVYRLRYDVYVTEMRRPQPYADHERRLVSDPLDKHGIVLSLHHDDEVVGTVRLNSLDGDVGPYRDLYALGHLVGTEASSHVIVTALMFAPDHRGTAALVKVFQACFAAAWERGVTTAWVDCNDHLVPMFLRFGFVRERRFLHPLYGEVQLLRLNLRDTAALRSTPFHPVQHDHRPFLPSAAS
jgi:predicted GNAT family N-acyltransferase